MTLEELLVHGHILLAYALAVAFEIDDAVDHEEGIAVRQKFHDFHGVEHGFAAGDGDGVRTLGFHALVLLLELGSHLGVDAVAGHDGNHMAHDAVAAENEVADEVHGLVTGAFVMEAQAAGAEVFLALDDDSVVQRATLNEALFQQRLNVLVEAEGTGVGKLLLVGLRGDDAVEVLRHAAIRAYGGEGDAELAGRHDDDGGAILVFHLDGFADFPDLQRGVLLHDAGLLNHLHIGQGGTVADGRLVGVHFNNGVVHTHAGEG